jgi:hypothetical protein
MASSGRGFPAKMLKPPAQLAASVSKSGTR